MLVIIKDSFYTEKWINISKKSSIEKYRMIEKHSETLFFPNFHAFQNNFSATKGRIKNVKKKMQ